MNVDLFISSPQFQQWCMAHLNASREETWQIERLVQSSAFKNWLSHNPNGTVDQYLQALHEYRQTPEYQFQELQSQIYYMNQEIEELNDEVSELKEEIEYKDEEIQSLSSANTALIVTSSSLFAAVIVLVLFRKKIFHIIKQ